MVLRGKHKCYFCEKELNWLVTIKDDTAAEISNYINEERGIPVFTGKNKIEIDVVCPGCRNANKLKKNIK
jgi:hypothetical protein